jgi:hypothetical protein
MEIKCSKCKTPKDSKEFYKTKKKIIGFSSWCKECTIKKAKEGSRERADYRKNMFI